MRHGTNSGCRPSVLSSVEEQVDRQYQDALQTMLADM